MAAGLIRTRAAPTLLGRALLWDQWRISLSLGALSCVATRACQPQAPAWLSGPRCRLDRPIPSFTRSLSSRPPLPHLFSPGSPPSLSLNLGHAHWFLPPWGGRGYPDCLRLASPWSVQQARGVTRFSKLGKRKTCKAVAKRFIRTGSGKLKYWPAGKVHNMMAKSSKRRRQLGKPRYANKQQLKMLNKMLVGW